MEFRLSAADVLDGELPAFPENVPSGDYVVLEVEDHGSGMTPEVLGQALDPFFTTKEVGKGTGLGLPVAFGIIHGHQGFLTIDTAVGRGHAVSDFICRALTTLTTPKPPKTGFEPTSGRAYRPDRPAHFGH